MDCAGLLGGCGQCLGELRVHLSKFRVGLEYFEKLRKDKEELEIKVMKLEKSVSKKNEVIRSVLAYKKGRYVNFLYKR